MWGRCLLLVKWPLMLEELGLFEGSGGACKAFKVFCDLKALRL